MMFSNTLSRSQTLLSSRASVRIPGLLVLAILGAPHALAQLSGVMQDLGALGGPSASSSAFDTSSDGEVVVGDSRDSLGRRRAFRWTAASGMLDLGTFGGDDARAHAVSADGSVVVGEASRDTGSPHAFVWSAATGLQGIGTTDAARSVAHDCSTDGAVVVGEVALGYLTRRRAFRWTAASGIQDLGTLGGRWSGARGVSGDGLVVVGTSETASGELHAFRWSAATGMQDLGALAPGAESTAARASADGAVLVGWGDIGVPLFHALRWVNGALHDMGTLGSSVTTAEDVSADGTVVVGSGLAPAYAYRTRAFRWTTGTSFVLLGTLGGTDSWASGISADGSTIVGGALDASGNDHAFRWRASAATLTCVQTMPGSCVPSFEVEGAPSVAALAPFWLRVSSLPTSSFATVSYGVGAATMLPAQYGTLCVPGAPTRVALLGTGGALAAGPCAGAVDLDFNALVATSSDPLLLPGAHIVVQLLYRDSGAPSHALFSAALEFDLGP